LRGLKFITGLIFPFFFGTRKSVLIQVRNYQIKPEIPVGGRLNFFQKNWEKITDDQWIISIMKEGYKLEFLKKLLGSGIKETSVFSKNIDILQEEIDILIQKVSLA
jgi:hypothetical protein